MIRRARLLLLLLVPVVLGAQPQYSFEGEILRFFLTRAAGSDTLVWSVTGDFFFSNPHQENLSRVIWFPVPSTASAGVAEIQELSLVEPADSLQVELLRQSEQGFSFRLDLTPRSFATVRIGYSQRLSGREARYVLLTANAWGRPLPSSEITLCLERGLELEELPYPDPDELRGMFLSRIRSDLMSVYCWQFKDFVPDKDFIVRVK